MDRINIGIVGLKFGQCIIEQLNSSPARELFQIAAVCDIDAGLAHKTGGLVKARVYTDIDSLLADTEIPAIGLFTGPSGRASLIRRCIRAGKHVMTTKPFEVDSTHALEVLCEAREAGLAVHLNSPGPLLSPDLRRIKDWQEQLSLGRPVGCRIETWATYREQADGGWQDDPARCLGEPESVQVLQSRIFTGRPTPDNAQLGIRFKNGALANVFSSFCIDDAQHFSNAMTLNFESGTVYRNVGGALSGCDIREMELAVVSNKSGLITDRAVFLKSECSGSYQWDVFSRAVHGEKLENETTPEQIVAGMKVVEAMARAEISGRTESIV